MDYSLTKTEWLHIKKWFNELLDEPPELRQEHLNKLTEDAHLKAVITDMLSLCDAAHSTAFKDPEVGAVAALLNRTDHTPGVQQDQDPLTTLPKNILSLEQQPAMFRLLQNLLLISGGSQQQRDE